MRRGLLRLASLGLGHGFLDRWRGFFGLLLLPLLSLRAGCDYARAYAEPKQSDNAFDDNTAATPFRLHIHNFALAAAPLALFDCPNVLAVYDVLLATLRTEPVKFGSGRLARWCVLRGALGSLLSSIGVDFPPRASRVVRPHFRQRLRSPASPDRVLFLFSQ